jgi:hypothetical protein
MAGVVARRRIAKRERVGHLAISLDRSAETAVADRHELPVHVVVGSHSSALMFESDDGSRTIFTRQCPGSMIGGRGGPAARASGSATSAP